MTKRLRILASLLAVLICLTACVVTVYADDPAVDPGIDPGVDPGYDPGYDPGIDPGYDPGNDPGTGGGTDTPDPGYDPGNDPGTGGGTDTPDPGYVEPVDPGYSDGGNQGGYVYYDSDGNSYSDQSEVYVGGGQVYEPPISTAPSVPLYETDDKVDVNELSKNDWNDIAASLKNANTPGSDDIDDFGFIQKNTSKADNGHWILITGAALVLLSLAGFVYLIVSGVTRRKKMANAAIHKSSAQPRYASSGSRTATDDKDDYNDGYKASRTKSSKGGKRYKS